MTFELPYRVITTPELPGAISGSEEMDWVWVTCTALGHDMEHTGQNNIFHINSLSKYAIRYNDKSVLEQNSAAVLFNLVTEKHPLQPFMTPTVGPFFTTPLAIRLVTLLNRKYRHFNAESASWADLKSKMEKWKKEKEKKKEQQQQLQCGTLEPGVNVQCAECAFRVAPRAFS